MVDVGKYTIHGSSGYLRFLGFSTLSGGPLASRKLTTRAQNNLLVLPFRLCNMSTLKDTGFTKRCLHFGANGRSFIGLCGGCGPIPRFISSDQHKHSPFFPGQIPETVCPKITTANCFDRPLSKMIIYSWWLNHPVRKYESNWIISQRLRLIMSETTI